MLITSIIEKHIDPSIMFTHTGNVKGGKSIISIMESKLKQRNSMKWNRPCY